MIQRWRLVCVAAASAMLMAAVYSAVKEAYAEGLFRSGTREGVEKATRMAPHRAAFWSGLGELLDQAGEDPLPAMRAATQASPHDNFYWTNLGLRAEAEGKFEEAQNALLTAARLSRKYAPRWALANFFYRRNDPENFWLWTREALAISYGDRHPLFDLCWVMSGQADEILERAIPERRPVRLDFASYLAPKGAWEASEAISVALARDAEPAETNHFLYQTSGLLDAWRIQGALAVWNSLSARGLIPYGPLNQRESVVTNGKFGGTRLGQGFDWRVASTPGVFVAPVPGEGWRVWLDGTQPEQCELLSQFLPLKGDRRYRATFRYRAPSLPSRSTGLSWSVTNRAGKQIGGAELVSSDDSQEGSFRCSLATGEEGARLSLVYRRPVGVARLQGEIRLESLMADNE